MFESRKTTIVSAAILFLEFSICDDMKKVGVWGRSATYLLRHEPIFFCLLLEKSEPTWQRLEELKYNKKKKKEEEKRKALLSHKY